MRKRAAEEAREVDCMLAAWDEALADVGGDPAREDWENFRPLRLSREEDWSDWLAYLLRAPEGRSVALLFAPKGSTGIVEDARREETVADGARRADLVVLWSGNRATHVEVKIWDTNFGKTVETGEGCRKLHRDRKGWRDYLLLPEENEQAWLDSRPAGDIALVTWSTVACELRRGLLAPGASRQWTAFARALCGAIEQKILGVATFSDERKGGAASASVFRFSRLVKGALGT